MDTESALDEVMKNTLLIEAFANSAYFGLCEEQLIKIETDWSSLFRLFRKYDIYASFIRGCEELGLEWKSYNFDRYRLFLDEWKEEIQKKLHDKIVVFFSD